MKQALLQIACGEINITCFAISLDTEECTSGTITVWQDWADFSILIKYHDSENAFRNGI